MGIIKDNSPYFSIKKQIPCDPSLELSHLEGFNEGSHYIVSLRNKKNYLKIIFEYSLYLEYGTRLLMQGKSLPSGHMT